MLYKTAFEKKKPPRIMLHIYYESSFTDSLLLSSLTLRVAAPFMADCSWLVEQLVGCSSVVHLEVRSMAMLF